MYGGGRTGLMGSVADAALAAGGLVHGVILREFIAQDVHHTGLSELFEVDDMRSRKAGLDQRADAFVALPGGLGTLDELFEVLTLRQTRYHDKPVGLVDQDAYWAPLLAACRHMVDAGFVAPVDFDCLQVGAGIDQLLDALACGLSAAPSKPS